MLVFLDTHVRVCVRARAHAFVFKKSRIFTGRTNVFIVLMAFPIVLGERGLIWQSTWNLSPTQPVLKAFFKSSHHRLLSVCRRLFSLRRRDSTAARQVLPWSWV